MKNSVSPLRPTVCQLNALKVSDTLCHLLSAWGYLGGGGGKNIDLREEMISIII